jgi:hypothetical protein
MSDFRYRLDRAVVRAQTAEQRFAALIADLSGLSEKWVQQADDDVYGRGDELDRIVARHTATSPAESEDSTSSSYCRRCGTWHTWKHQDET